jgi:hypothetical protein
VSKRQRLNDVQLWQLILLFGLIALVSGSKAGVFGVFEQPGRWW